MKKSTASTKAVEGIYKYYQKNAGGRINVTHCADSIRDTTDLLAVTADGRVAGDLEVFDYLRDWKDICGLCHTSYGYIGMKKDGSLLFPPPPNERIYKAKENYAALERAKGWTDVASLVYMHFCNEPPVLVGLTKDGRVLNTRDGGGEQEWTDIVYVDVTGDIIKGFKSVRGIKKDGTVLEGTLNGTELCETEYMNLRGGLYASSGPDDIVCTSGRETALVRSDGTVDIAVDIAGLITDPSWKLSLAQEVRSWKNIAAVSITSTLVIGIKKDGSIVTAGFGRLKGCVEELHKYDIVSVYAHDCPMQGALVGITRDGSVVVSSYFQYDNWMDSHGDYSPVAYMEHYTTCRRFRRCPFKLW